MPQKKTINRRGFINAVLTTGTVTGFISQVSADPISQGSGKKIKMLTPDGKLVEVDESVLEKITGSKKASGKEVFEWMDQKHKK